MHQSQKLWVKLKSQKNKEWTSKTVEKLTVRIICNKGMIPTYKIKTNKKTFENYRQKKFQQHFYKHQTHKIRKRERDKILKANEYLEKQNYMIQQSHLSVCNQRNWNHNLGDTSAFPCSLQRYSQHARHRSHLTVLRGMNTQRKGSAHIHVVLFSLKNERNSASCGIMDGPGGYDAKWSKWETNGQMLHDLTCM